MEALKKQEQQWQAEEDARIMARYQEIVNDSARKSRAVKEANKQAADLLKRANALKSVAGAKAGTVNRSRKK